MTDDERKAEIERLTGLLSSSKRMGSGYAARVEAINARLKELQGE